jgi:hypothetical protein
MLQSERGSASAAVRFACAHLKKKDANDVEAAFRATVLANFKTLLERHRLPQKCELEVLGYGSSCWSETNNLKLIGDQAPIARGSADSLVSGYGHTLEAIAHGVSGCRQR